MPLLVLFSSLSSHSIIYAQHVKCMTTLSTFIMRTRLSLLIPILCLFIANLKMMIWDIAHSSWVNSSTGSFTSNSLEELFTFVTFGGKIRINVSMLLMLGLFGSEKVNKCYWLVKPQGFYYCAYLSDLDSPDWDLKISW